jgi:hypothetical protein
MPHLERVNDVSHRFISVRLMGLNLTLESSNAGMSPSMCSTRKFLSAVGRDPLS